MPSKQIYSIHSFIDLIGCDSKKNHVYVLIVKSEAIPHSIYIYIPPMSQSASSNERNRN